MSEIRAKQKEVTDVFGHTYVLTEKLGQGGQGVVWKTDNPKVLIKGFIDKDPDLRRRWLDQKSWLMRQDLADLHIAKPVALLKAPRAGYVMELMDGLISLTQMLERVSEKGIEGFLQDGGLARRLQLLKKLATTLALLHARGMMYGDLSPDNIYISSEIENTELWLIDCDNISFESKPCRALYTPDYGAPELVKGQAEFSTLTDIWSFAVIAYRLLTGNHPFKGDMVSYGEPELEEQALRGELPWIGHPEDSSNVSECGIPQAIVTTSKLARHFSQCFEDGLVDPLERPSMADWLEALHEAEERIVHCQSCASSYLFNREQACPFCSHALEPEFVMLSEYMFIPPDNLPDWHEQNSRGSLVKTGRVVILQTGGEIALRRNIPSMWVSESLEPLVNIALSDGCLHLDPLSSQVSIQRGGKVDPVPKLIKLKAELRGQVDADYLLHVGEMSGPHMVWRFQW
jgi:serine/threonine protein kinase